MLSPRAQNYHFAYTVFPQRIFSSDTASVLLSLYPRAFDLFVSHLWGGLGSMLGEADRVDGDPSPARAVILGRKHLAILIEFPEAQRDIEARCVALVFTPEPRYFVLGRAPSLFLDTPLPIRSTVREVTPTANARVSALASEGADDFLRGICKFLEIPEEIESCDDATVQSFADRVPIGPTWTEQFGRVESAEAGTVESPGMAR